MNPRELRQAMRQRRSELRESLRRTGRQARERLDQMPAVRRERARRRLRRTLGVAILLLLATLVRCECERPPPPPEVPKVEAQGAAEKKVERPVPPPPPRRQPLQAQIEPQARASYQGPARASPGWLDAFRLQVAARSPRLAQCFTGSDRPGTLRWTTSVNPQSGAASDHELEPVGAGTELRGEQRECVVRALSSPPYRLTAPPEESLPDRVSLVIEF